MKYFTISELLKSDTALKHNLWNGANLEVEENLRSLVERVLDPLREAYGKPIRVTSGYRCPQLNRLVGGAPNSQHMRGEAADIVAYSQSTRDCGSKPANALHSTTRSESMRVLGEASTIGTIAGKTQSRPNAQNGTSAPPALIAGKDPRSASLQGNLLLGKLIEQLGNFDQLIYEQCDKQGNPRWIHVSWKRNGWNRKQVIHT